MKAFPLEDQGKTANIVIVQSQQAKSSRFREERPAEYTFALHVDGEKIFAQNVVSSKSLGQVRSHIALAAVLEEFKKRDWSKTEQQIVDAWIPALAKAVESEAAQPPKRKITVAVTEDLGKKLFAELGKVEELDLRLTINGEGNFELCEVIK